ncbi:MAG: CoA-binding protein [Pseudomonadales bacterium]|nr:CoA-binding protein [Pseudomonadales bacterium]MCP5185117.1 CoA-binding protein [Pseudomonadales bacterium]
MDLTPYQDPIRIQSALACKRVAVVGLSSNVLRASHFVGYYLQRHGYEVVPVNPRETEVLGLTSYPTLGDIPGKVDIVDVFREPAAVPDIARDALAIGARFLWLQYNVISEEGISIAEAGGMTVIADRCIKIEHARYRGRMYVLGFNTGEISARRRQAG